MSSKLAAETVGISVTRAGNIWQLYRQGGWEAIKPKPRGRRQGEKRQLSAPQEKELQNLLIDQNPELLKLPFALWTRDAVRSTIKNMNGIELPLRNISNIRILLMGVLKNQDFCLSTRRLKILTTGIHSVF